MNFLSDVVFEPAVVKNSTTNDVLIQTWENVTFETDDFHPVIFTSIMDRTVGEDLYVAGAPTNYFGALSNTREDLEYKHLRISYAGYGIHAYSMHVRHAQFVHCTMALLIDQHTSTEVDNVLFYDCGTAFGGYNYTAVGRNVTVNQCTNLGGGEWAPPVYCNLALTNSLLVNVTSSGGITVSSNYTVATNSSAVFQTVGAGAHYLTNGSSYHNAGTTNIPASLLADLRFRTTYAPAVLTNTILSTNLILSPTARRDTNAAPDLGYHYTPLDHVYGSNVLTNATLTLIPGTALGTFTPGANTEALMLHKGSSMVTRGEPTNLVHIARYNMVQEQANNAWSSVSPGVSIRTYTDTISPSPTAHFSFTDWSQAANDSWHFVSHALNLGPFYFDNCTFSGGRFANFGASISFTNCLVLRMDLYHTDDTATQTGRYYNNTFLGGVAGFWPGNTSWKIFNNAFHTTDISASLPIMHGYNAFLPGATRISAYPSNDVVTNIVFQTGPLGRFYLTNTSPLLNAGSMNATNAGLYHFTTTTNQVKETNSTVDIGFHYVALGAGGTPLDYDGDGITDYWEDRNGNGSYDPDLGETDWRSSGSITIGNESAVTVPTSAHYSSMVNIRPGDGETVNYNPPIFSWFYATNQNGGGEINPNGFWPWYSDQTNAFRFQIATQANFGGSLAVDVTTPLNFYNYLAPLNTNATRQFWWRVQYQTNGGTYCTSGINTFTIAGGGTNWDRSMFADSGYHATNSVHPIFGFRAGQELAIYAWAQTQPEFTAITNRATVLTNEAYFTSHDAWATNNLPDPTYATSVQAGAFDRANQLGALLFLYKFSGDARWTNLATRGWLFTNVNKVALWWNHPSNNYAMIDFAFPKRADGALRLLAATYDWLYNELGADTGTFEGQLRTNALLCLKRTTKFWNHNDLYSDSPYPTGLLTYNGYQWGTGWPLTNECSPWDGITKLGTSHKAMDWYYSMPIAMVIQQDTEDGTWGLDARLNYMLARTHYNGGFAAINSGPYGYMDNHTHSYALFNAMMWLRVAYPQAQLERTEFARRFPDWWTRLNPYRMRKYHGPWGDGSPNTRGNHSAFLGKRDRGWDLAAATGSGLAMQAYNLNAEFFGVDTTAEWDRIPLRYQFRTTPTPVTNTVLAALYPEDGYVIASSKSSSDFDCYTNGVGFAIRGSPAGSKLGHDIRGNLAPDLWAYGTQLTDGGGFSTLKYDYVAAGSPGLFVNGYGEGDGPETGPEGQYIFYGNSPDQAIYSSVTHYTNTADFTYCRFDGTAMFTNKWHAQSNIVTKAARGIFFNRQHRYFVFRDEFGSRSNATFGQRWHVPYPFRYEAGGTALANETKFTADLFGSNTLTMNSVGYTYDAGNWADAETPNPQRCKVHVFYVTTNVGIYVATGTNTTAAGVTSALASGATNATLNPFRSNGRTYAATYPDRAAGLWPTNTVQATNWTFTTVFVPQQPGVSAPSFLRLDDNTFAVTYDGVTETNTFGTNYAGAYNYRIATTDN